MRWPLPDRAPDGNLFGPVTPGAEEVFEPLAVGEGVLVERIVSTGQATPEGEWLEQERDEWVVLLEGEARLSFADGREMALASGDHVLIRAGELHRVDWTRADPPSLWLAVHADGLEAPRRPF